MKSTATHLFFCTDSIFAKDRSVIISLAKPLILCVAIMVVNDGAASDAIIAISAIDIINSMSVKPLAPEVFVIFFICSNKSFPNQIRYIRR